MCHDTEESGPNSRDILSHPTHDSRVGALEWLGCFEHLQIDFTNEANEANAKVSYHYIKDVNPEYLLYIYYKINK